MRNGQVSILQHLGKLLNADDDATIVREPLPERWVELIKFLNEQERSQGQGLQPRPSQSQRS